MANDPADGRDAGPGGVEGTAASPDRGHDYEHQASAEGHGRLMMLGCAAMLVLVVILVATDVVGIAGTLAAVACSLTVAGMIFVTNWIENH